MRNKSLMALRFLVVMATLLGLALAGGASLNWN
jgi:hypothetical protein